ncbi:hypothetical protein H1P_760018 [Hyella patelloides LEGE 07179]|uniref:Uncharacterized protein n=1 Tax=Hyella patelloides LEGE 07179 TaxID=945734 RepID=A0A563W3U0_9CYAN|nr:hypothetical protein [Hyella patelloides]VEP18352.1 hypothetical protein H1P_760018 [Hyella patelloides LEGE 07179]
MLHKIDYLQYKHPQDASSRLHDYCTFIEKFGRTVIQSEEWELIKIKHKDKIKKSEVNYPEQEDIYIFLYSERKTTLFVNDELRITIVPFESLTQYNPYSSSFKVWGVEIDIIQGTVKFAHCMNFEILEELRNKGLGSYILEKLVQFVTNYPSTFKVRLHAKSIDENFPNNDKLVNGLYKKFNLLEAKTIADIKEVHNSDKIESLQLAKTLFSIIKESKELNKNQINFTQYVKKLEKLIKEYSDKNDRYQKTILIMSTIIAILIIVIVK